MSRKPMEKFKACDFRQRFKMSEGEVFSKEALSGANHYGRVMLAVDTAHGAWLTGINKQEYLDCLAAYSSANPGHNHPYIVDAAHWLLSTGRAGVLSNVVYSPVMSEFLGRVANLVPQLAPRFGMNGNKVLPKNGGVESVETAVKAARFFGHSRAKNPIPDGKQEIIVFRNNFHGRTTTAVSFSSTNKYKHGFGPLTPGFQFADFGDLGSVEAEVNDNTCAILVEPMQGEGGMYVPPDGFLRGLREIADKHDLMLIFDEIQVGLGRTGKMFAFEHEGVVPDALILGKAISGGLAPLSVFVTNAEIMDMVFSPGKDGSTYGGYGFACGVGSAALDVIEREDLVGNSWHMGLCLKEALQEIAEMSPHVKEVRGKGLFLGIEVNDGDAMSYCRQLLDLGMLVNDSHGHTIRMSPPLTIGMNEIDYIVERLKKVLL